MKVPTLGYLELAIFRPRFVLLDLRRRLIRWLLQEDQEYLGWVLNGHMRVLAGQLREEENLTYLQWRDPDHDGTRLYVALADRVDEYWGDAYRDARSELRDHESVSGASRPPDPDGSGGR